jgi:hypothetical protein
LINSQTDHSATTSSNFRIGGYDETNTALEAVMLIDFIIYDKEGNDIDMLYHDKVLIAVFPDKP